MDVAREKPLVEILRALESNRESPQHHATVFVLSNFTLQQIVPYLQYHGLGRGVKVTVKFGLQNAALQEVLNPRSTLKTSAPDFILVSQLLEAQISFLEHDAWTAAEVWQPMRELLDALQREVHSQIIVSNFIEPVLGKGEFSETPNVLAKIRELNQTLAHYVRTHSDRVTGVDLSRILRQIGWDHAWDARFWQLSQAPFRPTFLNTLAETLVRSIAVACGAVKKCLIVDADNTLWGGIIGEDGLPGIHLDRTTYPGRIYYEVQLQLKNLYERGVLLALVSKNNEEDVKEVFTNNRSMALSWDDFVCREINWEPKTENIRRVAEALNLGYDSFVFLDDSAYECDLVRTSYPDILVLQVPGKVPDYPALLPSADPFPADLNSDAMNKTEQYRAEFARKDLQAAIPDLETYLTSLELRAWIHRARSDEVERLSQLTQKTNQFNLTTYRYTKSEIHSMLEDEHCFVYVLRGADRFGETGLTNLLIVRKNGSGVATIDTFLMSCRVFERGFEHALLSFALRDLQRQGISQLKACYRPSKKNRIVENFWDEVGFRCISRNSEEHSYEATLNRISPKQVTYIQVEAD